MSKFLGGSSDVKSIIVENLDANKPVRSDASRQLVSGDILISEVTNLPDALNTKSRLDFVEGAAPANPDAGELRLYAKVDGALYTRDNSGNEVALGGGGVSGSQWQFDTSISAVPANGFLRFNNATPASATKIVINILDKDGNSYRPLLEQLNGGDAIYLESADLSNNKFYNVSSATDQGTHFSVNVSLQQETSAANYTLNQNVKVNLFVSGSSFDQTLNTTDAVQFQRLTISDTAAPAIELKDSTALNIGTVDASLDMVDGSDNVSASLSLTGGDLTLDNANTAKKTLVKGDIAELQSATTTLTLDNAISQVSTDANLILVNNANPTLVLNDTDDLANDVTCNISFEGTDANAGTIGHSAGDLKLINNVTGGAISLTTDSGDSLTVNSSGVVANNTVTVESGDPALIISDSNSTKAGMSGFLFFNGTDGNASRIEQKSDNLTLTNTSTTGNVTLKAGTETLTIDADTNLSTFTTTVDATSYSEDNVPGVLIKTGIGGANNYLAGGTYPVLTSTNNIGIGNNMNAATNGGYNIAIAPDDVNALTTGSDNVIVGGRGSAGSLNSGSSNVILGSNCGGSLTTGSSNIVIGRNTDLITNANSAVVIGASAVGSADSIALGANSVASTRELAIGTANSTKSIQRIKPGESQVCDLGSATNEFKDAYLSGSIILSAPPAELKTRTLSNASASGSIEDRPSVQGANVGVIPPTVINATTISTANLVVGTISADPSLTEVTFNQTIVVEQGITVPPGAPPADVDEMDVTTLVVKNATNKSTLTYSDTVSDRTFDFGKIETLTMLTTTFPDNTINGNLTPLGYEISQSDFAAPYDGWRAFDSSVDMPDAWVSSNWNTSTGVYTGAQTTSGYAGEWLDVQLPGATTLAIDGYTITVRNDSGDNFQQDPVDWRVYGSQDKATWTQLDSQTAQTFTSGEAKTIAVSPTAEYQYFRLAVGKIGVGTVPATALAIVDLRYSSPNACPSMDCLHVEASIVADGTIESKANLEIAGSAIIGTALSANNFIATTDAITPALLVKNGTSTNTLTYSATSNKTLDLANIESLVGGAVAHPTIVMTANSDPPYTALASTEKAGDAAWNAFADANWCSEEPNSYIGPGNTYVGSKETNGYMGEWVQLQNTSDMYISEWDMKVSFPAGGPKDFRLYKSDDGTSWSQIDEQKSQTGWTVNEIRTYTLAASHVAKYFRVAVNANNGDIASACIKDLEFRGTEPEQTIINTDQVVNGALTTTGLITCPMITFPKPFFECYAEANTTATTCTLTTTWYPVAYGAGTVAAHPNTTGYTVDTTTNLGRITFNGMMTKVAHCGVTISGYPSTAQGRDWQFAVFKNADGVPQLDATTTLRVPGSLVEMHTTDNAARYSTAIHTIPVLETGDRLEVYVRCTSDAGETWTMSYSNTFGLTLPNQIPTPQAPAALATEEKGAEGWSLF